MQGPEAQPAIDSPDSGAQTAANEPQAAESAAALASATVVEVERELQAALDAARAEAAEYKDLYLRAKAETENTRRRAQEEIAKTHKYAVESFAEALVPVMDSLEKALEVQNATLETLREGVELTLKQLRAAFERHRLVPIDPKGEKFDPNRHQAISVVSAEGVPPNHVVAVLQKGWMIADRVLRPALVTVAQPPS
ncbi:MAG: nucleotide exchange factor GrpE [Sutterellaceae bacterium]|nr:nucleotide exchange factor GrpE [Burkholderiaceae bacterium]MDW8430164.1 nucleotide exchange factor GrpE [Sutterellaceae bacterium]